MAQEPDKAQLELQKLALEVQRLSYEVREKGRPGFAGVLAKFSPLVATVLALSGFLFGVFQYTRQQEAMRLASEAQARREIESRDQEFMRPLWNKQLELYFKASELAATIATAPDAAARRTAEGEFWKLYEGPLIVVESKDLSGAMVKFGDCLSANPRCDEHKLRELSRALSTVIQHTIQEAAALRLSDFSKNKFQYGR